MKNSGSGCRPCKLLKRLALMLNSGFFIRTGLHFHIKRRTKQSNEGFSQRKITFRLNPSWLWKELNPGTYHSPLVDGKTHLRWLLTSIRCQELLPSHNQPPFSKCFSLTGTFYDTPMIHPADAWRCVYMYLSEFRMSKICWKTSWFSGLIFFKTISRSVECISQSSFLTKASHQPSCRCKEK